MNSVRTTRRGTMGVLGTVLAVLLSGCDSAKEAVAPSAPPEWALNLTVDGAPVKLPVEIMDVFLVEDDQYPETFEMRGAGVTLVGQFPLSIHVDYGENWDRLVGQPIPISGTLDNPNVAPQSTLELPNLGPAQVVGGSFSVDTVSGEFSGSDGNRTLSGNINLELQTSAGPKSVSGTFAVHAVTLGVNRSHGSNHPARCGSGVAIGRGLGGRCPHGEAAARVGPFHRAHVGAVVRTARGAVPERAVGLFARVGVWVV